MNDLEMYRESLALCDDKIIDALVERSKIVEKIMAYKEEYGMPILQPQQEAKQALRLEEKLNDNKYREEIKDIFECIRMNSKKIQARKLFDYNIVMIGFMGAGKSTVAEYLSTMFAMEVVEMDQEIVKEEGMSIPDIFATYGEEYFRNCETELLKKMQSRKNVLISCGGGVVLRECNVEQMKKNGRVVLLTASPEEVYERVKDSDDRPVLAGRKNVKGIAELMEARREKYEAAADIIINGTRNADARNTLAGKCLCTAECTIAAAADQAVNAEVAAGVSRFLQTFLGQHLLAACGVQHGAALADNAVYTAGTHLDDVTVDKTAVTAANAENGNIVCACAADYRANKCVHAGCVAAAGKYADSANLFIHDKASLLSVLFSFLAARAMPH